MRISLPIACVVLPAVFLTGCETLDSDDAASGTGVVIEDRSTQADDAADQAAAKAADEAATASGARVGATFEGHPLDNPQSPLANRIIYFEYDSSSIRSSDRDVIQAHAEYMGANPGASIVLEGHTDERGSREYNIALGEQRARAVRQLLLFQGAATTQIQTVSYGEERPAAIGHNEDNWQQNRRVEILYKSR